MHGTQLENAERPSSNNAKKPRLMPQPSPTLQHAVLNGKKKAGESLLKLPPQLVALVNSRRDSLVEAGFLLEDDSGALDQEDLIHQNDASDPMDIQAADAADGGGTDSNLLPPSSSPTSGFHSVGSNEQKKTIQRSSSSEKKQANNGNNKHSVTRIVAACQNRFTRELSSYTRAACMRLGYD